MTVLQRHIISRVLAAFVAIQLFIMPLFWVVSLSVIKSAQHRLLQEGNEKMTTLVFNDTEFAQLHFIEEDEIRFNDVLYDIKSIQKEDGMYVVNAFADEKEEALLKLNPHKTDKKSAKYRLKIPLLFFETSAKNIGSLTTNTFQSLSSNQIYFLDLYLKIPTPPPEAIA